MFDPLLASRLDSLEEKVNGTQTKTNAQLDFLAGHIERLTLRLEEVERQLTNLNLSLGGNK